MMLKEVVSECVQYCRIAVVGATVFQFALGGMFAPSLQAQQTPKTASPIKHVIIIVGENRSFDHIFATYKPKAGESVDNLLSKHIVNEDGTPGSKYWLAQQYSADITGAAEFQLSPTNKTAYGILPAPLNGGPTDLCKNNGICSVADAIASEDGLPNDNNNDADDKYYGFLTTGGS